jgi:hypothetical protein
MSETRQLFYDTPEYRGPHYNDEVPLPDTPDVPREGCTPEGLATALLQALQAEGFDAFRRGNPYNISHQVWPVLVRVLRQELGP